MIFSSLTVFCSISFGCSKFQDSFQDIRVFCIKGCFVMLAIKGFTNHSSNLGLFKWRIIPCLRT